MKASLKKKWIAALRSGKYKRGEGHLKATDPETKKTEWCCLGVLADVAGCRFHDGGALGTGLSETYEFIPDRTAKQLGIGPKGEPRRHTSQRFLATRNDSGWSFNRIANWIEKNL